jgi:hypothetical protein
MAIHWRDYQYILHKVGGPDVTFEISDEDISGDPSYFGYLSETGSWIIQQRTASTGAYRYCMGQAGYFSAWTSKASNPYVLFNLMTIYISESDVILDPDGNVILGPDGEPIQVT